MRKWIVRTFAAVLALLVAAVLALVATALRTERPVGFQVVSAGDPGTRSIPIAVWYPTEARPWPTTLLGLRLLSVARDGPLAGRDLPLVVISHGNGGGPGSHADLAMSLAEAGFVAAAPLHAGDNFQDESAVGTAEWLPGRTRELRAAVSHLTGAWAGRDRLAAGRIGLFGFSAGGFAVLAAVGASPDLGRVAAHCARSPELACQLLQRAGSPLLQPQGVVGRAEFAVDDRIRAAVVAAPGLGFAFDAEGLSRVKVPVQLWSGAADTHVPAASNAGPIAAGLGARAEVHAVPGAGHFSFLVPCALLGPPALCQDGPGFDRKAFHRAMAASVIDFLRRQLR